MDPCPFVRLTVGNLALKIPVATKPARSAVHPSSSPCFCKIKLKSFPLQNAVVPYIPPENAQFPDGNSQALAASFHLSKPDLDRLSGKSSLFSTSKRPQLKISVYSGRRGSTCSVNSGRLLGKISVPLDLAAAESRAVVFHNGWINVGKETKGVAQFHLNVKAEPDPRFVFEFDRDPECSPQVFQIRGTIRQPVFTCKFSFRTADRNQRSRSLPSEYSSGARGWLSSFGSERERPGKERKGWSITIHDLSGSPVAAASMVTPFVASPGSDRVSRSNPGCWLILRPGDGTWKPWGRLEAWRERGAADGLGYRFELIPDSAAAAGIVLAESTLSCSKGGKFLIDLNANGTPAGTPRSAAASPGCSPRGSGDFGNGLWPYCMYRGFVMSARVEGEGSNGRGKTAAPLVEVSVQHVNCTEDAAAFVALSAALDLSMDACRLFSHKLRKELCPPRDLLF
ncbi:hypothetical protein Pfo_016774 [Paulownia fortunei]|nr:hypothetical protein Pfo_016774 [Paulownia fortunei]